jgi:hypothetical protein
MIWIISWYIIGVISVISFLKIDTGIIRIKDILFAVVYGFAGLIGLLALVDLLIKDEDYLKKMKLKALNILNKKIF